jgi:predicted metal-dependent phosphotriesterase family hydrolase
MLQTCDVGFSVEEEGRRGLLMLDVARNTGRNIVATWGEVKKDF